MRRVRFRWILLIVFVLLVDTRICGATNTDPFRFATTSDPEIMVPGETGIIHLSISMPPDHYMYADRLEVTPDPVNGIEFGSLEKPKPKQKKDPIFGMVPTYEGTVELKLPITMASSVSSEKMNVSLRVSYQGCTKGMCFMPMEKVITTAIKMAPQSSMHSDSSTTDNLQTSNDTASATDKPKNRFQDTAERFGIFGVLIAAFVWGIFASLTPCVYPMIPITVSVIGGAGAQGTRRGFFLSVIYILGLSLVYAIFGTIAALSGELFGQFSNHPSVRITISVIFLVLALGMFDVLHIQMPATISSRLSGLKGTGPLGIFITGMAAGAVVGPCVGPLIVALLIYIAGLGNWLLGFVIMWSFALGMSMLFLAIGTFSGAMAALPKAGPWMEWIKRCFGMVMLAVALYYIHPLLPERIFHLILGGFLIGCAVFIGAFAPFDTSPSGSLILRKTLGVTCLIVGACYVISFSPLGLNTRMAPMMSAHGEVAWQTDEATAIQMAKSQNKPIMIDFYADWCTACKEMERVTFSHPDVIKKTSQFVCLKLDFSNTEDPNVRKLQQKYSIVGLPTIRFINSQGQLLESPVITEVVQPDRFIDILNTIK